jgi:Cytochrome c7 and related cytochrome c/Class III cytochrome C family
MTSEERDNSSDMQRNAPPDRRLAIATFVVSLCAAGAIGFVTGQFRSPSVDQPIAFNHKKHVVDNQLGCSTCHTFYETETFSGLPDADVCSTCHSEPLGKSAEEAKLVRLLKEKRPLVWSSLFRQPSHVFYSHRRHVMKAQIRCERCHGNFAQTTSPPRSVKKLKMADCIGCHEEKNVSVECTTCHR